MARLGDARLAGKLPAASALAKPRCTAFVSPEGRPAAAQALRWAGERQRAQRCGMSALRRGTSLAEVASLPRGTRSGPCS